MNSRFLTAVACAGLCAAISSGAAPAAASRPVTVDDLMRLRAILDVRISPDGERVAYVVSTPALPKNEHEAALFVVGSTGGQPTRTGDTVRIFNVPVPRPQLRWSPDGTMISVLGFVGPRPQVFAIPVAGGAPKSLTAAPEGVSAYEWSPDGKSLAFLTRDPMSADEERQRQDRSFVIRADAPD
ncbi:MAG TPA: LpqB family beta-propeller domain-containing protein, partial [Vicinamibacterales bacterium]|nr:LpqB family beta-propeller domain-containing protein [Vicinamibacterales bacterium]